MDTIYFKEKLEYFENEIQKHKEHISELKKEYIDQNAEFKIGDKIEISYRDRKDIAIIKSRSVNYLNEVEYQCFKIKKDGEISKQSYGYISNRATLKKAE